MYAKNITVDWNLPSDIMFIVELWDGSKRTFYFGQQSETYAYHILWDADEHYGQDNPWLGMTVTYKTCMVTAISRCLKVLEAEFSEYAKK